MNNPRINKSVGETSATTYQSPVMTTIYLDTSAIIDEHFMRSATAHAFLKACGVLGICVVIPEVVHDETIGNYPKFLKERISALQKAHRDLAKLMELEALDLSLDKQTAEFKVWFDAFMQEHNVTIAPYPAIPLKELVQKSYVAQKPFKVSGEGHKDYLVWSTILQHIDALPGPNFFLTKNTKDFCADASDGLKILHPELAAQIAADAKRPEVYTSMKVLFDEKIAVKLEGIALADFKDFGKPEIDQHVNTVLEEELPQYNALRISGLPFNDDVTISSVQSANVDEITLIKVGDEIVIDVSGTVEIEVDGFIDKTDYYHSVEEGGSEIYINDADWNDHVMWASTTIETPFDITLIYSISAKAFTGNSLTLTQEIVGHDY